LLYALGVFGYVLDSPDIGLRCAFAPVINHVDDSFASLHGSAPAPQVGDTITQLGTQKVETWPELLRAQAHLRRAPVEAAYPSLDDFNAAVTAGQATRLTCVEAEGKRLVRVQLRRSSDGGVVSVWRQVGSLPLATLIPSLLWFFLKAGLFAVGALVFWKRPEDRSARHFPVAAGVRLHPCPRVPARRPLPGRDRRRLEAAPLGDAARDPALLRHRGPVVRGQLHLPGA